MSNKQTGFLAVYFILLFICIGLLIGCNYTSLAVRDAILPIAADGFKLVLGAIVGTLSAMLGVSSKPENN